MGRGGGGEWLDLYLFYKQYLNLNLEDIKQSKSGGKIHTIVFSPSHSICLSFRLFLNLFLFYFTDVIFVLLFRFFLNA